MRKELPFNKTKKPLSNSGIIFPKYFPSQPLPEQFMKIALVNTNLIKPPIAPIGLEYVAEALVQAGFEPDVLDLNWSKDPESEIKRFFRRDYRLVGVTLRNSDDCTFTNKCSFLDKFKNIVSQIKAVSNAPVILGGVGYSTMPGEILLHTQARAGVWGEGEFVFPQIARRIAEKTDWTNLPGLVLPNTRGFVFYPSEFSSLSRLPVMTRSFMDNLRYFNEGGQAGVETKRGCPRGCIYCADPVAKGTKIRLRPPAAVADEFENLLKQGIDHIHVCDSEFNYPEQHAIDVCTELSRRELGNRMRWYTYCSPLPFSSGLAAAMSRAGCAGINFGVDSTHEYMLKVLRRDHRKKDVFNAAGLCKKHGIAVMFDLLLGAPGETYDSIKTTIDDMNLSAPDCIGISLGVRVYPFTPLAEMLRAPQYSPGLSGGTAPQDPLFFLEPAIAGNAFDYVETLVAGDPRFFFFNPENPNQNYNYNANDVLVQAIQNGRRGAYWDILRKS